MKVVKLNTVEKVLNYLLISDTILVNLRYDESSTIICVSITDEQAKEMLSIFKDDATIAGEWNEKTRELEFNYYSTKVR